MTSRLAIKDRIFLFVSLFYVIYIIFPLFADVTGIPVYVPAIIVVMVLMALYPKVLTTKSFLWFCLYIGVIAMYILFGKHIHINGLGSSLSSWNKLIIEAAWILPSICILSILIQRNNLKLYKSIGLGSLLLLLLSFVYILPSLNINANYLREDMANGIRTIGMPGYDLMHAYALMVFPLCLFMKKSKRFKKLMFLFLVLFWGYMVTKTAVTTSLFLMLFSVLIVYIYNPNNDVKTIVLLIIIFIISVILKYFGVYAAFLEFIMPYFEGTAVYDKLLDMYQSLSTGMVVGDTLTGRMDYHAMSRATFMANPLLGSSGVGGHSKILDVLGSMGLLAFIPYMMILISSLKLLQRQCEYKSTRMYLLISFLLASVFLYIKGIFGAPGYLFMLVLVPSLIIYFESIIRRDTN